MSTLKEVSVDLAVQIGSATMPVHQLLRMGRGAVIALDRLESEDVTLLAQDTPVADAQIVVQGERISVKITRMLPLPPERRGFGPFVVPGGDTGGQESLADAVHEAVPATNGPDAADDQDGDADMAAAWEAALAESEDDADTGHEADPKA